MTQPNKELREALARAYCSERNSHKVLDPDLIEDMVKEIALLPQPEVMSVEKYCECSIPNAGKLTNAKIETPLCNNCYKPIKQPAKMELLEEIKREYSSGQSRPCYPLPFTIEDVVKGINQIIKYLLQVGGK